MNNRPVSFFDVLGLGGRIAAGLFGDAAEIRAFALGLDNAAGFAVDEQHVVRRAGVSVHLTHGDTKRLIKVEALYILDYPACRLKFFVDLFAGFGFEFWVFR